MESLHFPLIKAVTKTRKPLLISTGTLSIKEIDGLIKFLRSLKFKNYILLHCITNYPTKIEDTNLKTISYIKNKYKCLVGFSDHTSDTICANAAIANGANVKIIDLSEPKLNELELEFGSNRIEYIKSSPKAILNAVKETDLLIGAVYDVGKAAPKVITLDMIKILR